MDINWNSKTQSQILKIEFLRYFFKTTETYLYIGLCICFSFFPLLSCIKESSFPKFLQGPSPVPFIWVSPRAPCLEAFSRNSCRVHCVHPRGKEASEKVLRCRLVEKPETATQRKLQKGRMNTALKSRFWKKCKTLDELHFAKFNWANMTCPQKQNRLRENPLCYVARMYLWIDYGMNCRDSPMVSRCSLPNLNMEILTVRNWLMLGYCNWLTLNYCSQYLFPS